MAIHNEAQRRKVMAKLNHLKSNGFTAYSVSMKKKVKITPNDRIVVEKRKLPNGNQSVIVVGHVHHNGKIVKVPRIVGQI